MFHLRPGSSSSLDTHSPVASSSRAPYPVPTTNKSTGSSSASPPTTTSYRPKRNRWSTVEGLGTDHSRSTESGILGIGDAPFTSQGLSMRARAEIRGPGGHKDQKKQSQQLRIAIERHIKKWKKKDPEAWRRYAHPHLYLRDVDRAPAHPPPTKPVTVQHPWFRTVWTS